jgi:hypothetical protein
MFPVTNLTQDTQSYEYYEIHSVLLPICTVATAVKVISM